MMKPSTQGISYCRASPKGGRGVKKYGDGCGKSVAVLREAQLTQKEEQSHSRIPNVPKREGGIDL